MLGCIWRDWLYASEQVGSNKTECSPLNRVFITVLFYPLCFSRSFLRQCQFPFRSMFQAEHCHSTCIYVYLYIYIRQVKKWKKKESVRIDAKKILQDFIFQFFFQRSSCSRVYSNCTELYLVQIVARNWEKKKMPSSIIFFFFFFFFFILRR